MNRRQILISAGLTLALAPLSQARAATGFRTQWKVRTSEGFDAICFVNPLSGDPFYADYYAAELALFKPRLKPETVAAIGKWFTLAQSKGMLLGPSLCTLMSGAPDASLDDLIAALKDPERIVRPGFEKSPYWDADEWQLFLQLCPDFVAAFADFRAAGFADFRNGYIAPRAARLPALRAKLASMDTIGEQERLLGRRFDDPSLEIVLLYFSQPHGIKIQGQRFLTHIDYPDHIVIRNADHEMLHPPFDMDGAMSRAIQAALNADPLFAKILAEHDKRFGYNSMQGILDEDTVQALEQIVNERLGVAEPPAQRWTESDDGMHVLAAGLYGLLKSDGYDRTGGNIAQWMAAALKTGRLAPAVLHEAAAKVLQRPADKLWPLQKS
ncbi:MAG TPA: hypothetical protein VG889_20430 [Rhizomicrobium sp.]|nr:hypothetical protein [Rhizomicrobium sp.]